MASEEAKRIAEKLQAEGMLYNYAKFSERKVKVQTIIDRLLAERDKARVEKIAEATLNTKMESIPLYEFLTMSFSVAKSNVVAAIHSSNVLMSQAIGIV